MQNSSLVEEVHLKVHQLLIAGLTCKYRKSFTDEPSEKEAKETWMKAIQKFWGEPCIQQYKKKYPGSLYVDVETFEVHSRLYW